MDTQGVNSGRITDPDLFERAARAVTTHMRWVDDFPAAGVRFADLTPVFADGAAFAEVISALASAVPDVEVVAGIDARGFLLGGGIAHALGIGVLAVRKKGKLPPPVQTCEYTLEYGTAAIEIPGEWLPLRGRRVLVVDDVLATGGTLAATLELLERVGADVVGVTVVTEIEEFGGRERLRKYPLTSLVRI